MKIILGFLKKINNFLICFYLYCHYFSIIIGKNRTSIIYFCDIEYLPNLISIILINNFKLYIFLKMYF